MADDSGGGGFSGFLAGLVLAAILLVGGVFLYTNGGFGHQKTAELNVHVANPVNGGGNSGG